MPAPDNRPFIITHPCRRVVVFVGGNSMGCLVAVQLNYVENMFRANLILIYDPPRQYIFLCFPCSLYYYKSKMFLASNQIAEEG